MDFPPAKRPVVLPRGAQVQRLLEAFGLDPRVDLEPRWPGIGGGGSTERDQLVLFLLLPLLLLRPLLPLHLLHLLHLFHRLRRPLN